jgi:hypothetical protein
MRACLAAGFGLLLTGCATVAANDHGGVIENASSSREALAKADAQCAKDGKAAKVGTYDSWAGTLTFECVAR